MKPNKIITHGISMTDFVARLARQWCRGCKNGQVYDHHHVPIAGAVREALEEADKAFQEAFADLCNEVDPDDIRGHHIVRLLGQCATRIVALRGRA